MRVEKSEKRLGAIPMTTLTVEQLDKWYRKTLSKRTKDFVKIAERSFKIVERSLKDIEELAHELAESSGEEETESEGIASRFAMKINDIVENFVVATEVTYATTEAMKDETQKFMQDLWGAGARWIRRMDKKHKAIIKSLDVYLKELSKEINKINKLLFEFSWVKDLERIGTRIATLRDLTFGRVAFEEQIRTVRQKITAAQSEYEAAKNAFDEFKESSNVSDLLNLDDESEHIASVLRMKLNILKKPVKKFLQHDTGVLIGPAGQKALVDYFEDPFTAIVEEPDGTPGLLEGLDGLREALERRTLKMKDRLIRRTIEEIEAIRGGSLKKFQETAKAIDEKRRTYADSDVYAQSDAFSKRLEEATKNLEYHSNDLLRIRDEIERQIEKVEEFRHRVESEIMDSFDEKIIIKIDNLGLEPLLVQCSASNG